MATPTANTVSLSRRRETDDDDEEDRPGSDTRTPAAKTTTKDQVAGGVSFTPSPEILFLVQQQAKTISTLSAISKRLEELEVKVCDIQRTVATASSSKKSDQLIPSSSKCSAGPNVLSDDSGGEYSRTTNGTTVDEDELVSLLDQIAKYSQTIRDTQQSQAQQQLLMASMSPQHQPHARRDVHHHQHAAPDHPSSSPAALMNEHHTSSSSRLNHHNQNNHHQQQHHRNQSLTHATNPSRSSASSSFPGLRPGTHRTSDSQLVQPLNQSSPPGAESTSLGALLFDPNLSSVLANLLTPPRSRNRDF